MTRLVCSITALASDAKKYSTSLSSSGWNSDVDSVRGINGTSRPLVMPPCGRCSVQGKSIIDLISHLISTELNSTELGQEEVGSFDNNTPSG